MNESINMPLEWTEDHPLFEIPEWRSMECGSMEPQDAARHFLILGETGAGKTKSAVMPIIRTAFRYPSAEAYADYVESAETSGIEPEAIEDLRPSMLVIDPKFELSDLLAELREGSNFDRKVIPLSLRQQKYVIHLFEGTEPLSTDPYRIASRLFSISKYREQERGSREPFWLRSAEELIKTFLAVDHHMYGLDGVRGIVRLWIEVKSFVRTALNANKPYDPTAEARARAFRDTYDKYSQAMDTMEHTVAVILAHYGEDQVPESLRSLADHIGDFIKSEDDYERGRAYDKLYDALEESVPWCLAEAELHALQESPVTERLVDLAVNAQRAMRLGNKLAAWPNPEQVCGISKDDMSLHELLGYNRSNYLRPIQSFVSLAAAYQRDSGGGNPLLEAYLKACKELDIPFRLLLRIHSMLGLAPVTFSSIIAVTNAVLEELASEELSIHLSLNPYEPPEQEKFLSVQEAMDSGACVVYSPGEGDDSEIADLVGRSVKSKFFEFMFKRTNRIRPFVYICDEFQRYITSDRVSGEQSFLDRCRAFRGICALATQSLASLEYALSTADTNPGVSGRSSPSLRILLNNTGNKLFFRNTDVETQEWLGSVMPAPYVQGKPHLTAVRTIATLEVGECYYLLSRGEFGRGRAILNKNSRAK